jgi:hypothetical protein
MLLGSAGLVAAAGSLILGFRNPSQGQGWARVMELVLGLIVLVGLSRSPRVDRWLTKVVSRVLHTRTDLVERDLGHLTHLADGYAVAELAVREGEWLEGRTVREIGETTTGVLVLGVQRAGGAYEGAPAGNLVVDAGDALIIYGNSGALDELDRRPAEESGPRA